MKGYNTMKALIQFLLQIAYKNRTKQKTSMSIEYGLSGVDEKILKINTALDSQNLKLQLDNDYIILDKNKSLLLLEMIQKSVQEMEQHQKSKSFRP